MVFFNSSLRLSFLGILFFASSIQCRAQNKEQQHRQTMQDVSEGGADGTNIVRCGTAEPTSEIGAATAKMVQSWKAKKIKDGWKGELLAKDVNVYFHIIKNSLGTGFMSQTDVTNSLEVLNNSFQDFNFIQAGVTVTINDKWFSAGAESASAFEMFQNLRRGDQKDLNVYYHKPGGGLLGYATVPWEYADYGTQDGVVIDYESIPGGSLLSYNEGDTLVHEVGHWLGLLHTFQVGYTTIMYCANGNCSFSRYLGGFFANKGIVCILQFFIPYPSSSPPLAY